MSESENTAFVPVLTVMPDFGNAPFLWRANSPDDGIGPMICESGAWEDHYPMSEALWRKFAIWARTFERISFYSGSNEEAECWDWPAFHERGLQLARWLKEEVGDAYRVVYQKPGEDPNDRIDERREILADGSLQLLPSFYPPALRPFYFCERIVSGGQTGADRAALDFAIRHGYPHGGWAPRGREAEDGCIPLRYQLTELEGGYRQRTRRNVEDSDGTLIVNRGALDGGTLATKEFAGKAGKPFFVTQVDEGVTAQMAADVLAWLQAHDIKTLNVAGPRESKRSGIEFFTKLLLEAVEKTLRGEDPQGYLELMSFFILPEWLEPSAG